MWAGRREIIYNFIQTQLDKWLGQKLTKNVIQYIFVDRTSQIRGFMDRQGEISYYSMQNKIKVSEPMQFLRII